MFRKVLVPLDGSRLAEQALGAAMAIANASTAALDLIRVHPPTGTFVGMGDASWTADQWNSEHQYLAGIAKELEFSVPTPVHFGLVAGDVATTIDHRVRDGGADLVVMVSHGRTGLSRAWLGSVADAVLQRTAVPLLILRPQSPAPDRFAAHALFRRVLVPLDGSAAAEDILPWALDLAHWAGGRITLLRVVRPVPMIVYETAISFTYPPPIVDDVATKRSRARATREVTDVALRLAGLGFTDVETQVEVAASVPAAIIDCAHERGIDLIAMSTHGGGASRLLFGTVADHVVRGCELPILLRRPVAGESVRLDAESVAQQLPALSGIVF